MKDNYLILPWKDEESGMFIKVPVEEQFAALWVAPARKLSEWFMPGKAKDERRATLGDDAEALDLLWESATDFYGESMPFGRNLKSVVRSDESLMPVSIPFLGPTTAIGIAEATGTETDPSWFRRVYKDKADEGWTVEHANWLMNKVLHNSKKKDIRSPEFTEAVINGTFGTYSKDMVNALEKLLGGGPSDKSFSDIVFRRFLYRTRRAKQGGPGTDLFEPSLGDDTFNLDQFQPDLNEHLEEQEGSELDLSQGGIPSAPRSQTRGITHLPSGGIDVEEKEDGGILGFIKGRLRDASLLD